MILPRLYSKTKLSSQKSYEMAMGNMPILRDWRNMKISDWLSTLNPLAVYDHYRLRKDLYDSVDIEVEIDPQWPTHMMSQDRHEMVS